ncbi:hypothetical protein [Streptomyces sp. CB01201]|nr:hypothetical protein [Streptomyces sp. CB01201]
MTTETLSVSSEQAHFLIKWVLLNQQLFVASEQTQWTRATEDKPSAY